MSKYKILNSPGRSPDMDPALWRKLPEELIEQVLSCLPLKSFLYLRSTCKRFHSLTFSPSFISKHFSSSSSSSCSSCSFLLLSHPQFVHQYFLYNTNLNSWRSQLLSVSSLLPPSATLISAARGLLCFSVPDSRCFLICNLLSKSSKTVNFPVHPFEFEGFTLIVTISGYKLFAISPGSCVFLYHSKVQSWQTHELQFSVDYRQKGVCYNSRLYYITRTRFAVVGFDLEAEKWEQLAADPPREIIFGRLVCSQNGKMYLFGGIGNNGISRSLKIWELSEGENSWVEIGSVPDMMCRKLVSVCFHNYDHLYVFWHQDMICVCCYSWPEILYYKVSRRTWHWLPKCPSMPEKWSCGFKWFSFLPQLHPYI